MPTSDRRRAAYVALSLAEGLHGTPCPALLDAELDPEEALSWNRLEASARGVRPAAAARLGQTHTMTQAKAVLAAAAAANVTVLCPDDPEYPQRARRIPLRPAVLFLRGNPRAQRMLSKLERKHGKGKALSILAHKLGRTAYYMLVRNKPFDEERFFAA